jgi:hypothetical protein
LEHKEATRKEIIADRQNPQYQEAIRKLRKKAATNNAISQ